MKAPSPELAENSRRPGRTRLCSLSLLAALLLCGCDGGRQYVDTAWCNEQSSVTDPLPELFEGLAGPQKVADDYVQRDGYSSGIAIATVSAAGTRFYVAGETRWAGGVAASPDTVFEIASITKVFTSLLLADAVLRGELSLDDRVDAYLPADVDFPDSIQLRHLATHTAGLPRDARGFTPGPYDPWYEQYGIDDLHRFLDGIRPSTEPGTRYSYSNLGAYLLGHVLSVRTGMTYEELLAARVLGPLGMPSTYVHEEPPGAQLATPYAQRIEETDYFMVPVGLEGAGRIRSTARDMARFAEAAMRLRSTSLDQAFALAEALHYLGPDVQGAPVEVGLGWGRGHSGGSVLAGHGGGSWGFTTSILVDLDQQVGTIVLTNSRHARDCLPSLLTFWLTGWQRVVVPAAGTLADYPGPYAIPSGTARITLEGSHLLATLPGQASQRIYPEGNDRFFSLFRDVELKFEREEGGRVSGLVVRTSADPGFLD